MLKLYNTLVSIIGTIFLWILVLVFTTGGKVTIHLKVVDRLIHWFKQL